MVGPYTITNKQTKKTLTLWAVTMIDAATGWFEMKTVNEKDAMTVANVVEQVWLTRYPWPEIVTYDKGTEFMGDFGKMIKDQNMNGISLLVVLIQPHHIKKIL